MMILYRFCEENRRHDKDETQANAGDAAGSRDGAEYAARCVCTGDSRGRKFHRFGAAVCGGQQSTRFKLNQVER